MICVGMGNEGISSVHQSLTLTENETVTVEFSVGEYQQSTNLQLWKSYTDRIRIFVESPRGAMIGPLEENIGIQRFRLQDTELLVYYGDPTPYSVLQEIYIDFLPTGQYLTSGIWKLLIEPVEIVWNLANLWLPVSETSSSRTRFLTPSVEGSFTVPAAALNVISVAAYDSLTDSYADFSGRAFNVLPWAGKPDLAAPGVDIMVPSYTAVNRYENRSGTSIAAGFYAGMAGLLLEYGIVRGNIPYISTNEIRNITIDGCEQSQGIIYPNREWGYGRVNIYNSIENLRE